MQAHTGFCAHLGVSPWYFIRFVQTIAITFGQGWTITIMYR